MPVSFPRPNRFALLMAVPVWVLLTGQLPAAPADSPPEPAEAAAEAGRPLPEPLVLEEALEPLPPERQRTEGEQDLVEALSRFSAARTLERQDRLSEALRFYQRAWRYDPQAAAANAVVRSAIQLKRYDEAVRIALEVEDPEALGATQLMTLGAHLIRRGEWPRAAAIYEKVLAAREGAKPTVGDVALRMEMGRLYHLLDQPGKAAECFDHVREALADPERFGLTGDIQKDLLGEPGPTYALMGTCFLRSGRIEEAVAAFEQSHQLEPNQGLLDYRLAQVEAEKGNPAEALSRLQKYFDEHLASEKMAPYRLLARLLEGLGRQEELVARLEQLWADDPQNVPLGYFLAETYRKTRQFDKAESLYRRVLAQTPTVTGYRSLVEIYRETNRPEALVDLLGEAAGKGVATESLGGEDRSIARDADLIQTLIAAARERVENEPDQFGCPFRSVIALLALDAKQYDAAEQFFELALEADPDKASELLLTWGLGLLSEEQYAQAAEVFQRGIGEKVLPEDNPVFHFYRSGALEMAGRPDEALAAARKAVELDGDSPRLLSRVGWILYRNDRREEAAKVYGELIDKFDSEFSSLEVRNLVREARMVLSNLAVLAGDLAGAENRLEEVLDEFPGDVGALNDLGYLWADRNVRLQRACRMIRKAVEEDPDNVAYRDSLGWVLYRLGRVEEALVELEKAAAGDEPDPVILDHLGDVYHANNQPDQAEGAWRRAVEAFKKAEEPDKVKTVEEKIKGIS